MNPRYKNQRAALHFVVAAHLLLLLTISSQAAGEAPVAGQPFPLWPEGAPGAKGTEPRDIPTLTPYWPDEAKRTGGTVIVCPGGGYAGLAAHEAEPIAKWLNAAGVTSFVLRYRHAPGYSHPIPLQDAARAIRTVRAKAKEWNLDPTKIGILGFSAGGHLTSTAATHFDAGDPNASDPIERVSSRPDVAILIYPVITMKEFTHGGSKKNLIGENPSAELVDLYSNEERVTKNTPPCFLVHAVDDKPVPVENTWLFAQALRKAGVPHEAHIYETGGHGFGLGEKDPKVASWPKLCETWLKRRGF